MAQIKTGTVQLTNNSSTVKGLDVEWDQVIAGCLFIRDGDDVPYVVASKNLALTPPELYLTGPYMGATIVTDPGAEYTIVRDFTANLALPLLYSGDVETAVAFSRAMMILDAALSGVIVGGGGGTPETQYTKVSHGYNVGTVLRVKDNSEGSPGTFDVANSADAKGFRQIGMVSEVVDSDTFKLKSVGQVTGITALTLTAGKVYYLKAVGGVVNLTDDSAQATIKSPIFISQNSGSGFFIGGSGGSAVMIGCTGVAAGAAGLVPAPAAGDQDKALCGDGTYKNTAVGDGTITMGKLDATNPFTTEDWDIIDSSDSPKNALVNLHTRIKSMEDHPPVPNFTRIVGKFGIQTGTTIQTIPLGASITKVKFRAWSGGSIGTSASVGGHGGGYAEGVLVVPANSSLYIDVGRGANRDGVLAGATDTVIRLNTSGGTLLVELKAAGASPGYLSTPSTPPASWLMTAGTRGGKSLVQSGGATQTFPGTAGVAHFGIGSGWTGGFYQAIDGINNGNLWLPWGEKVTIVSSGGYLAYNSCAGPGCVILEF